MNFIVQLLRLLTGGLFIFSGIIKANDPTGFSIKLSEYFAVFGTSFLDPLSLSLSIFICVVEIVLGVVLLLGVARNLVLTALMAMIVFFTFLTFYSAYFNVVNDCGCFGDFIKLTPWESFTKDLILLVFIVVLWMGKKHITPILAPGMNRKAIGVSTVLALFFSVYTSLYLPVWDFRPYKVGNNIKELMEIPEGAPEDEYKTTLTYKNTSTGEEKTFDLENMPEGDEWEWVSTNNELVQKGYEPPIHDFAISNAEGYEVTKEFLQQDNKFRLVVVQPKMENTRTAAIDHLIELANASTENRNLFFWSLTASNSSDVKEFKEKYQIPYPIHFADETTLKTIIRSNPGLLLLEGNTIVAKWSSRNLPSMDDIKKYL